MNRDEFNLTQLALSNILDVIPWIDNTGSEVNGALNRALVRLYERNMAVLNEGSLVESIWLHIPFHQYNMHHIIWDHIICLLK